MDNQMTETHYVPHHPNDGPPIVFFFAFIPFLAFIFYLNWKYFKRWHRVSEALEKIAVSLEKIAQNLDKK